MKIDIFAHVLPRKYKEALYKTAPRTFYLQRVIEAVPTLFDMDRRFRIMDKFAGLAQVLTLSSPPVEQVAGSGKSVDLARLANDEMADLVAAFPERFPAAVACLPMDDMDAALQETDRAVRDLHFKGVQMYTPINDQPLDLAEFRPLYEKMAGYNLPIWIHPHRTTDYADYRSESKSMHLMFSIFGWPYETTAAMTRLVFNGLFDEFPTLKVITHHGGGMVPFFAERISGSYDHAGMVQGLRGGRHLARPPIDYFKMFYYDTAIYGNTPGLMCTHAFCGVDKMLFASDMPYDSEYGERYTRQTIQAIENMGISAEAQARIFEGNARAILNLSAAAD